MNKELIKKYKTEFNHYINGGSVLARRLVADNNELKYTIWYEVDAMDLPIWTASYLFSLNETQVEFYKPQFVINDKFVEFRKAGAADKQLQVCYPNSENPTTWYDKSYHKISWSDSQLVRLKPEPTIKVGDWVFDLHYKTYHRVTKVLSDKVELDGFNVLLSAINNHNYKLWEPEVGEWCVIDEVTPNNKNFIVQKWQEDSKWTPIPYTGPIPHFIKD